MTTNPKRPSDANQLAKMIVDLATGDACDATPVTSPAAELGRLGGQKGGKARADALSAERRSEIAKKAAAQRWKK